MPSPRPQYSGEPRAVLYLRQSVSREESISLELQEIAGREYCRERGYTVTAVESDPGISGRTWKRPAVQRVMASVEAREADVIVLWKWSRLSRSRLDWAVAVDRVESVGGRIESATEPLDTTTSTGRFARGMLTEFAAFESERIGDVWKETHARRRNLGLPPQGGDRFGYVRDGSQYAPNEDAGALREMYERYISGEGFTRIAKWLNDAGYRTLSGGIWDRTRVTRVLDSGFGAGQIVRGRGPRLSHVPAAHPPIVTEDQWADYQARRADAPPPPRTVEPQYFLSGLIKCGDCGAPMHASSNGGPGRGYTCSRWSRAKDVRCVTAIREAVEQYTLDWMQTLASAVDEEARVTAAQEARKVVSINNSHTIASKLASLDTEIRRVTRLYAAGDIPLLGYTVTMEGLQREHENYAERARVAHKAQTAPVDFATIKVGIARWSEMSTLTQREFLSTVVKEVRVFPPTGHPRRSTYEVVQRWETAV
jgi:site-specific DNA recombinase